MSAAAAPPRQLRVPSIVGADDMLALASHVRVDADDRIILTLEVPPAALNPVTSLPSHLQYCAPDHADVVAWRARLLRDRRLPDAARGRSIPLSATLETIRVERSVPANAGPAEQLLVTLALRLSR